GDNRAASHGVVRAPGDGKQLVLPGKGANPECFEAFPGSCPRLLCRERAAQRTAQTRTALARQGRPWLLSLSTWICPPASPSPPTSGTATATASRSPGPGRTAAAATAASGRQTPASNSRRPCRLSGTWTSGASPASGPTNRPSAAAPPAATA